MPPTPNALTSATARPESRGDNGAAIQLIPFVRAAQRMTIPANIDQTNTLGSGAIQVGVFELPATGWLRSIPITVTASDGAGGDATGAFGDDGPYSVIDQISVTDPAGNTVFGPVSGYELYLINRYGGYDFQNDPADWQGFDISDVADGNFAFQLSIPIEASARDGYGSLTNSDSGAAYRVNITQAAETAVFTTPPDTLPNIRFQAHVELWTEPSATDLFDRPQAMNPPGPGTKQYWTREINPLVSGTNRTRIKRVGNLIRNFILVARDSSGDRIDTSDLPVSHRWQWDNLTLTDESRALRLTKISQMYGELDTPDGVLVFSYCDDLDGHPGFELRNALLPTTQATRLEFEGTTYGATAAGGSLTVLINDIYPQGGLA